MILDVSKHESQSTSNKCKIITVSVVLLLTLKSGLQSSKSSNVGGSLECAGVDGYKICRTNVMHCTI